ncbi:MAG TPA: type II toxin-antitoxin system RelE/ParE family toxin [Chthoniobacteraceae bacterium]|jgi:plasmid stabilization system protein ParE|nr:type II toxin-antitoxin system RelE/ParE family toxin [Chthoniobacteraceae bacterium]
MSLAVVHAKYFPADVVMYGRWYAAQRDETLAEGYVEAVNATLELLARSPGIGTRCSFTRPSLADLRFFPVLKPFNRHVLFYRYSSTELVAFRAIHGMRDLQRRLLQPPNAH